MSTQKQKFQLFQKLQNLGFTYDESVSLRRAEMTLQRWGELECGTGDGQTTRSIERDGENGDGKPFMRVQYPTQNGYHDSRYPVADREAGALKRLAYIVAARNARAYVGGKCVNPVKAYHQTDCRGCNLYIVAMNDYPEHEVAGWKAANVGKNDSCFPFAGIDSIYTRGLAVCC